MSAPIDSNCHYLLKSRLDNICIRGICLSWIRLWWVTTKIEMLKNTSFCTGWEVARKTIIWESLYYVNDMTYVNNYIIIIIIINIADKYANLRNAHPFQPITLENLGAINESATSLISEHGHKISVKSNDPRESIFLFQRLSVTLQRFSSIL